MRGAADNGQNQAEENVRAHDLRGSHFRIVQQEDGTERSSASGRKSGLHADGKGQPWQPMRIVAGKALILRAWQEADAGGKRRSRPRTMTTMELFPRFAKNRKMKIPSTRP